MLLMPICRRQAQGISNSTRAPVIFQRIWDQPPFAVDHVAGSGRDLVIAFSSVGHDPGRAPSPEFVATATGRGTRAAPRPALFVTDASRSWANHPDFERALRAAVQQIQTGQIVDKIATIGLSMGAFSALAAARILPVDVVLAFSPQWSILPAEMPGETRWRVWTEALPEMRWPTAPLPEPRPRSAAAEAAGWICLFHGTADDMAQARAFPRHPGVDQLLFADHGHSDLVPHLKARGLLPGLLEAALAGDRRRLLRIAASSGGRLRRDGTMAPARDGRE